MKKAEKIEMTKQKLISAATELMEECEKPEEVTARAITLRAGVQLSMMNYCFGSREALLFEAFSRKEKEFLSNPKILLIESMKIPPKEKLRRLHYVVCEYLVNQYKFTQAVVGYVLLHRDLTKDSNSLPLVIEHYKGRKTEAECKIISYELSSIMQLAVYRKKDLRILCGVDLSNKKELENYVDFQIDLFLTD